MVNPFYRTKNYLISPAMLYFSKSQIWILLPYIGWSFSIHTVQSFKMFTWPCGETPYFLPYSLFSPISQEMTLLLLPWQMLWQDPFFTSTSSHLYNQNLCCYVHKAELLFPLYSFGNLNLFMSHINSFLSTIYSIFSSYFFFISFTAFSKPLPLVAFGPCIERTWIEKGILD